MPATNPRARGAALAGGRKRYRSAGHDTGAAAASDLDDINETELAAGGARSVERPSPLSPGDTRGIAEAVFLHSKPHLLSEWATCARNLEESLAAAVEKTLSDLLNPAGPLSKLVRCVVREEVDSLVERHPKVDAIIDSVTEGVRTVVIDAIKTTPPVRSTEQMSKAEVGAAVAMAVGYKKIRELLPEVLSRRIMAIANDDSVLHDVATISFPAASKKRQSYANEEFDKIVKSLVHKVYEQNALKDKDVRPPILRNKERLLVHDMDLVDYIIAASTRAALHDGRSEARKLFFRLFAFFLMILGASMELVDPLAEPPALGAGASSMFFAVRTTLQASSNGQLGEGNDVHTVNRTACLYDVASQMMQGIALQPFPFPAGVLDPFARNLRAILVSPDRAWTKASMKDAESMTGPGSWGLLLPMLDCRQNLIAEVQTLTPCEKYLLRAEIAPDSSMSGGAATTTEPSVSVTTSDCPAQPAWL